MFETNILCHVRKQNYSVITSGQLGKNNLFLFLKSRLYPLLLHTKTLQSLVVFNTGLGGSLLFWVSMWSFIAGLLHISVGMYKYSKMRSLIFTLYIFIPYGIRRRGQKGFLPLKSWVLSFCKAVCVVKSFIHPGFHLIQISSFQFFCSNPLEG